MRPNPETMAEIADLKAHYFEALDGKRWAEMEDIFSPDAEFEGFAFDSAGRGGFISAVSSFLADVRSEHRGSMPRFHEVEPGLVRVLWPMHDYLTWPADGRSYKGMHIAGQYGLSGWGFYEEECRLQAEGCWRISFSRLTRTRIDALTPDGPLLMEYNVIKPDPSWIA